MRRGLLLAAWALAAGLGGCASAPPSTAAPTDAPAAGAPTMGQHPADPWEAFNRQVFAFNEALDENLVKPVAVAYRDLVPQLVRTGVDNVFGNINDLWSAANHLLQGKFESGAEQGFRFMTNTLLGLGGLLDPATEMRLVRRTEDFGQTLGRWGVGPGPYLVLPLFGPRNVRDSFGLLVDRQYDPDKWLDTGDGRWALFALEVVNVRTNLLAAGRMVDQIAIDRYSFLRDFYLARRLDAVYDGAPPMETFQDEPDDESGDEPTKPKP
jgi:phospholipid-binding lipoprotein MlaA